MCVYVCVCMYGMDVVCVYIDMEDSCNSQDMHVLEGWAEVIELGKKLLFAYIHTYIHTYMHR